MGDKFEFGSVDWLATLRKLLEERLATADLEGVSFSFSEEYTDPPAHLRVNSRGTVGWHVRITDGIVETASEPAEADTSLVADYQTMLPVARTLYSDGEAALAFAQSTMVDAIAAGALRFVGRAPTDMPPAFQAAMGDVHDAIASRTA